MAPIAEANRRRLDAAEYAATVQRTHALICEHAPPGAAVAVISRGDEALLALEGRRGWHFPRAASGAYAGHHPPDSASAVAHLAELQASGAQYLAVPGSARWWLDHYEDFAQHLQAHGELLADEPACALYALAPAPPPAAPSADPAARERMRRFLDALLPEHSRVLIAGHGWEQLELPRRAVLCVSARAGGGAGELLAEVERHRHAGGPAYVVLPLAGERDEPLARLRRELERRRPPLARRDRLALVFDLQAPTTTQGAIPA